MTRRLMCCVFFFSSRRRHTRLQGDWSSDVCSSDLTHPDLFWAIKGGGGGSWGVVTRLALRTHELPQFFGFAYGKVKAQSDEAFSKLLGRFFEFYVTGLFNPHWGEQVRIGSDNTLQLSMVSQGVDQA